MVDLTPPGCHTEPSTLPTGLTPDTPFLFQWWHHDLPGCVHLCVQRWGCVCVRGAEWERTKEKQKALDFPQVLTCHNGCCWQKEGEARRWMEGRVREGVVLQIGKRIMLRGLWAGQRWGNAACAVCVSGQFIIKKERKNPTRAEDYVSVVPPTSDSNGPAGPTVQR